MDKAVTEEEKIVCIAKLFQLLEWLHPFPDGQGRTDLILLSKILCDHGLNPPILKNPYFSTCCLLEDWIEYLKNGIDQWKKEVDQEESKTKNQKAKTVNDISEYILKEYEKRKKLFKGDILYYDGKPFFEEKYLEKIRNKLDLIENAAIASENSEEKLFAIKKIIHLGSEIHDLLPKNELRKRIRRLAKISSEDFDKKKLKSLGKAKQAAALVVARPSIDVIVQRHLASYQAYSKDTLSKNLDLFYTEDYVEKIENDLYFVEQWTLSILNTRERSLKLKELVEKIISTNPPLLPYEKAIKKSQGIADRIPMDSIKKETLEKIKKVQSELYQKKTFKK